MADVVVVVATAGTAHVCWSIKCMHVRHDHLLGLDSHEGNVFLSLARFLLLVSLTISSLIL